MGVRRPRDALRALRFLPEEAFRALDRPWPHTRAVCLERRKRYSPEPRLRRSAEGRRQQVFIRGCDIREWRSRGPGEEDKLRRPGGGGEDQRGRPPRGAREQAFRGDVTSSRDRGRGLPAMGILLGWH